MKRPRLVVLASGGGSTFENLVVRSRDGRLAADVVLLVVSRPDCGAVARAQRLGVPLAIVPWKGNTREQFDRDLTAVVDAASPDLVCMGGFLRLWTFPPSYDGRVLNVHPALLPSFGGKGMHGRHVHEAVLASGAKESGCTVHFATRAYDEGPAVVQRRVPVLPGDTADSLAARVLAAEFEAYPEAIALVASGRRA